MAGWAGTRSARGPLLERHATGSEVIDMTTGSGVHTVLALAEGEAFGSLRKRPTSRRERFAIGRALRKQVPRMALGRWEAAAGRRDPIQLIQESHQGRLEEL